MTRWSHGHSLAVGIAGGLVLDRHVLAIATIFFLLGVAVAVAGRFLRAAKQVALERGRELHEAMLRKVDAEAERKHAASVADLARAEGRVRTKSEQDKEVQRAYVRGVADGAHS